MTHKARSPDRWIMMIFAARVLMYANFMVYAACLPLLLDEWQMSATQAGSIASGFMISYAVSLFVSSWLADHIGARRVFLWSAMLSAVTALLFGLLGRSYISGLIFYALAASTQGGLYTPAIMLFSDRYEAARRGSAVGYLIASTSVGYAFSLLLSGLALSWSGYEAAFVITGTLPVLGAVVSWIALRTTPNRIHPRSPSVRWKTALWRNRQARVLVSGYTFHCWELLGMWSWTPAFFAASAALAGHGNAAQYGAYFTAAMHLVGSVSSASMGRLSDRLGRRIVLCYLAATSALVSLVLGWLIQWPIEVLFGLGLIYYFTAIGDSPVWSTALSESVEPAYLGSILALRALLGFAAGAVAPVVFGVVLDWTNPDGGAPVSQWGWAFVTLGAGGVLAAIAAAAVRSGAPGR